MLVGSQETEWGKKRNGLEVKVKENFVGLEDKLWLRMGVGDTANQAIVPCPP